MHTVTPHIAAEWSKTMLAFMRPPGQSRDLTTTMQRLEKTCWPACAYAFGAAACFAAEAHNHTDGYHLAADHAKLEHAAAQTGLSFRIIEPGICLIENFLRAYHSNDTALIEHCSRTLNAMSPTQRTPLWHMISALVREHTLMLSRAQNYALHRMLTLTPHPHFPQAHIYAALHTGAIAAEDDAAENAVMGTILNSGPNIAPEVNTLLVRSIAAPLSPWDTPRHPGSSCEHGCGIIKQAEEMVTGWVTSAAAGTKGVFEAILIAHLEASEDPHLADDFPGHLVIAASHWLAMHVREHCSAYQGI